MKIVDFVSDVTRKEGGKEKTSAAQVAEVFKIVNRELWGLPYGLVWFKRNRVAQVVLVIALAALAFATVTVLSGCATQRAATCPTSVIHSSSGNMGYVEVSRA